MDKAYIVANDQQKNKIREKSNDKADFDSQAGDYEFPYVLVDSEADGWIYYSTMWSAEYDFGDHLEIVFDGRKEEQMSDKYVVSQTFMNSLKGWKHDLILEDAFFVNQEAINNMPKIIKNWWVDDYVTIGESNKRLISIIRYMSGANDFEVEKSKKWAVRSKDVNDIRDCLYVHLSQAQTIDNIARYFTTNPNNATKFDTKEEAQEWANSHQEVVQVEVDE